MAKKYTLDHALKYIKKFEKTNDLAEVLNNFEEFKGAIEIFAYKKDEENFKRLTDKYIGLINFNIKSEVKENAYKFLETLCLYIDNKKILKTGNATKLLKKIYSEKPISLS